MPGNAFVLTDLMPGGPPVALTSYGKRNAGLNHLENINEAKVREAFYISGHEYSIEIKDSIEYILYLHIMHV